MGLGMNNTDGREDWKVGMGMGYWWVSAEIDRSGKVVGMVGKLALGWRPVEINVVTFVHNYSHLELRSVEYPPHPSPPHSALLTRNI